MTSSEEALSLARDELLGLQNDLPWKVVKPAFKISVRWSDRWPSTGGGVKFRDGRVRLHFLLRQHFFPCPTLHHAMSKLLSAVALALFAGVASAVPASHPDALRTPEAGAPTGGTVKVQSKNSCIKWDMVGACVEDNSDCLKVNPKCPPGECVDCSCTTCLATTEMGRRAHYAAQSEQFIKAHSMARGRLR